MVVVSVWMHTESLGNSITINQMATWRSAHCFTPAVDRKKKIILEAKRPGYKMADSPQPKEPKNVRGLTWS